MSTNIKVDMGIEVDMGMWYDVDEEWKEVAVDAYQAWFGSRTA